MFTVNTKLEGQPSHESLRRARWWAWAATGATVVSLPLVPAMPLVHLLAIPILGGCAYKWTKQYQDVLKNFDELRRERGFKFINNELPQQRDQKGRIIPWKHTWQPEWVPHESIKTTDIYLNRGQPKSTIVWRRRLLCNDAWMKILEAQIVWIREITPERWNMVSSWWENWYLYPLLMRRHGTIEVTEEQLMSAAQECKVELHFGASIAGQPTLWTRKIGCGKDEVECFGDLRRHLYGLYEQLVAISDVDSANKVLAKLDEERPRPFPRHDLPVLDKFFIGRGFYWDQRHTQAYEDLMSKDLSEVTRDPAEQGDPRILGLGHRDVTDLFMEEVQFSQHCGIFGSSGVGKTVYATCMIRQAIRSGHPVLVLDPKSDKDLLSTVVDDARRYGRMHQLRYMTLASPKKRETWNWMCTYSPTYSYVDPSEIASRTSVTLPESREAFWANVAKGMCQTCYTMCHWSNWFLRFLDRRDHRALPARDQEQVPMILLAMQYARHHSNLTPQETEEKVLAILAAMKDPNWKPSARADKDVVDMLTLKSLEEVRIYSPKEWIPSVRHISEYEVDNTVAFLGWMLRIFYPHLYLQSEGMAAPDYPKLAPQGGIVSKSGGGKGVSSGGKDNDLSMWSTYQNVRFHPLELRYIPNSSISPEYDRWIEFYEYFVPRPKIVKNATDPITKAANEEAIKQMEEDEYNLRRMFKALKKSLDNHFNDCQKERQKFLEYATTLQEALKPLLGERARTICAIESDIVWDDVVDEGQIVVCSLGSLIDSAGSESCAKMLLEDLASYVGQRYQFRGDKARPFWVIADELSSFINKSFVSLLNKARGAGLRVSAIGQTTPDLEERLGGPGAKMAKGNFNTFIQLRSQLTDDARDFAERAGQTRVTDTNRSISITPGVGDAGHQAIKGFSTNEGRSFQSRSTSKVPPAAVLNLPRGQAWIHAKGQTALVSQGMFTPSETLFQEEIGLFQTTSDGSPGVMRELMHPYDPSQLASVKKRTVLPQRPVLVEDNPERQGIVPDFEAEESNAQYEAFRSGDDPASAPVSNKPPVWARAEEVRTQAPPPSANHGSRHSSMAPSGRAGGTLAPVASGTSGLAEDPAPASSAVQGGSAKPRKPSSVRDAAFDGEDGADAPPNDLFL